MTRSVSRRSLLGGKWQQEFQALRPPWAGDGDAFLKSCDACLHCVRACPEGILLAGPDGYPTIDFSRGGCNFCGDCAAACESGALSRAHALPWQNKAQIDSGCLSVQGVVCRLCEEQCEAGAIRFRPALGGYALPTVDNSRCTGCGACVRFCPNQSIDILETAA